MKSRESFEEFCMKQSLNLLKDDEGYLSPLTEILWETWKKATIRAANIAYDCLDDPFLSGHGYAENVSRAINE